VTTLLSVNNYYYYRGGAETVFLEQNQMFEALGWNVVPFSMRHPKNLASPWTEYFVDEIEFDHQYSLAERLMRVPKVIYSFEARRNLRRLLDRVQPDVCHAHNIYHHISPSILGLLKRRGIPTVMTLHDLKIACPEYHMLAPDGICERCRGGHLYNVVLNRCIKDSVALSTIILAEAVLHRILGSYRDCVSRFIVPSRFYIEKFVNWGLPKSLFRHIPNFVDVRRYVPRFTPGRDFVYFGRISPEKGLTTLIHAAAAARCRLVIAGTGPELHGLSRLAEHLGAAVTFLGHLTGDALRDAVSSARAVVLPSEWYENAPMSVLEAYALGKPVIGARIGGIPELIQENDSGITFESGNRTSLATALSEMASKPDTEIERIGRCGRQWVEVAFCRDVYQKNVLDVYREIAHL
jgi:glycosyltransferase involved in cell wall biosynthesis